jgi:DnaJ-class molecular chaperone
MSDSGLDGYALGKRICNSCEGYSRTVEDGICAPCRGESSYNVEQVRAATKIILGWKSEQTMRTEAWAETYLSSHREARRKHLAGRPGHK